MSLSATKIFSLENWQTHHSSPGGAAHQVHPQQHQPGPQLLQLKLQASDTLRQRAEGSPDSKLWWILVCGGLCSRKNSVCVRNCGWNSSLCSIRAHRSKSLWYSSSQRYFQNQGAADQQWPLNQRQVDIISLLIATKIISTSDLLTPRQCCHWAEIWAEINHCQDCSQEPGESSSAGWRANKWNIKIIFVEHSQIFSSRPATDKCLQISTLLLQERRRKSLLVIENMFQYCAQDTWKHGLSHK